MTKLTRRQFLGTSAAGALAAPHVWVKPAWAQQKQLSILTWSHFVPAYDKWFDQWGQEWAAKNGVKLTIDHIPHLNLPAKIAAEVATQTGHDIVQMAASGAEKWAPALLDVNDLADKLGKKYGGWSSLAENYSMVKGHYSLHPRLLHRLPGALPEGSLDRDRHAQWARHVGRTPRGRRQAQGEGLPRRDRARPPQRLPELVAGHHVVPWRLRGRQGRQDHHVELQGGAGGAQVLPGPLQGRHDARGAGLGRRLQQPPARLGARLVDPQPDQRVPHHRGAEQGAGGQDLRLALAQGPGGAALLRQLPRLRRHQVLEEPGRGEGLPRGPDRQLPGGRQGEHRLQHAVPEGATPSRPLPIISEDPKLKPLEQDAEYHFTIGYPGPLTAGGGRGLPAVHHGRRAAPSSARTRWTSSRRSSGPRRRSRRSTRSSPSSTTVRRGEPATGRGRPGPEEPAPPLAPFS